MDNMQKFGAFANAFKKELTTCEADDILNGLKKATSLIGKVLEIHGNDNPGVSGALAIILLAQNATEIMELDPALTLLMEAFKATNNLADEDLAEAVKRLDSEFSHINKH